MSGLVGKDSINYLWNLGFSSIHVNNKVWEPLAYSTWYNSLLGFYSCDMI